MAIGTNPAALIRTVRERRFAEGLLCPHCDSRDAVRWGRFSGRQRYRCKSCGRCFSDLTATTFSYVKRLDVWPVYFSCLTSSTTVRRAAAAAGVAVSTSFRWRHRILQAINDQEAPALRGAVEFAFSSLPYSRKGQRRGGKVPVTTGVHHGGTQLFTRAGCHIVVARDRLGGHLAERFVSGIVSGEQLRTTFGVLLADDATLLVPQGRLSAYGWLQRATDGRTRPLVRVSPFRRSELHLRHNRNAHEWLLRFHGWLTIFRGVATKYVPNYLSWWRVLHQLDAGPWMGELLQGSAAPP